MPNTLIGLAIAAFVVLPGIVYYSTTGSRRPGESFATYSPRILASGLAAFLVALCSVLLISDYWANAPLTSAADLAEDGAAYVASHTRRLVWTGLLVLAASVTIGWLAGRVVASRPLLSAGPAHYAGADPWWVVLQEEKLNEGEAYAYVNLRNGSSAGGLVVWFSSRASNYSERDLVLMPWSRSVDEFQGVGMSRPATLRDALFSEDVDQCDISVRLVIPGDQIADLHVRFVPAGGVREFREQIERWGAAQPQSTLQCFETMGRTIVHIRTDERISIHRASGSVIVRLATLRAANKKLYNGAKAFLESRGASKRRRPRGSYELPAADLLDGGDLHPDFIERVLVPLTESR